MTLFDFRRAGAAAQQPHPASSADASQRTPENVAVLVPTWSRAKTVVTKGIATNGTRTLRSGLVALLLGARTLLGAKGVATRNKKAASSSFLRCSHEHQFSDLSGREKRPQSETEAGDRKKSCSLRSCPGPKPHDKTRLDCGRWNSVSDRATFNQQNIVTWSHSHAQSTSTPPKDI